MSYYRTCPYCDAALDPGETCDCRRPAPKRPTPEENRQKNIDRLWADLEALGVERRELTA